MNFKFVLDENITILDQYLPDNVINVRELYYRNGLRQFGIEDRDLLKLARTLNYVVITKDTGMVIRASYTQQDIVFVDGPHYGKKWYLIPKGSGISNRLKLRQFILKYDKGNSIKI